MTTMREMCETIVEADFLRYPDGSKPTAQQVFEYSPTGELMMVFGWYEIAQQILGRTHSVGEPPTDGIYFVGDKVGAFVCTRSGTPGTWVNLTQMMPKEER